MAQCSRGCALIGLIVTLWGLMMVAPVLAERASQQEMDFVAENWLTYMVFAKGDWEGSQQPVIDSMAELYDGTTLLARCYFVSPSGHVVVPVLKELPPVKAYSEHDGIDVSATEGYAQLLRDVLRDRMRLFRELYGSVDASQPDTGDVLLGRRHRQKWNRYAVTPRTFLPDVDMVARNDLATVGPLLETHWDQGSPYNDLCPPGQGGAPCVVGCVATAFAQIMVFHQWPSEGVGSHTYYWNGDQSCGGNTPGANLTAHFSDPYDWDNMPIRCDMGCSPEEAAASAELSYEVGVSFHMNYGVCGSGAWPQRAIEMYPRHFLYDSSITARWRENHTISEWFDLIKGEINDGRPCPYTIHSHEIACDGWREVDDLMQYHMNYGWADGHDRWYTLDELYCPWAGCDPMVEYMIINMKPDKEVLFNADTNIGAVPFTVQFTGSSVLDVDSWTWDFGDEGFAYEAAPVHTFTDAGIYDITLTVTSGAKTRSRTKYNYIIPLADSLVGHDAEAAPGSVVEIVVHGRNTIPLHSIKVPVEYTGTLGFLSLDSFSTVGCRTDYFEDVDWVHWDGFNRRYTVGLVTSVSGGVPDLEPGEGNIIRLFFSIPVSAQPGQTADVSLDGYENYMPMFSGELAQYPAVALGGSITIEGSCCVDRRGNVDSDPDDLTNIIDLTYLAEYLFGGGPVPACWQEANVNGDQESLVNVVDITYLVSYLFGEGQEPPLCP